MKKWLKIVLIGLLVLILLLAAAFFTLRASTRGQIMDGPGMVNEAEQGYTDPAELPEE